jgi:hypothetical protein
VKRVDDDATIRGGLSFSLTGSLLQKEVKSFYCTNEAG